MEDVEFETEFAAYERIDMTQTEDDYININELPLLYRVVMKNHSSLLDGFETILMVVAKKMSNSRMIARIPDIQRLMTFVYKIPDIKYFNPMGLILGYIATDGGGESINSTVLKDLFSRLKKGYLPYGGWLYEADIVRYARWFVLINDI